MTRLARRNRTKWIKRWKKQGYVWRRKAFWQRWRWTLRLGLTLGDLPIWHSDHEMARNSGPIPDVDR